jgi:PAS domain S-box-containing protein
MLDPGGHIVSWNDGAQRLKGYTESEIVGKHFSIFYPEPTKSSGWPEYELEVAAREGRFEDEGWRVRKDGTQFWADVVITAVPNEKGELIGFAKVTRDLTERKRAEESVRQSEERYRTLVEEVRDYAIFMLDPGGHVVTWNKGAERLKGYTLEEIVGKHFSVFYPPEAIASKWPWHELEVARVEGRFEDEGWRVRKDGSRFWANVVITAVYDSRGILQGFSKVTRDVSERKRYEEFTRALNDELRERVEELAATNRALSEKSQEVETFVYSVSHDVRGPLVNLQGFSEEIQRSCAELLDLIEGEPAIPDHIRESARRIINSDINEATGFMTTAVAHLGNIVDALLRLSRVGRVVYQPRIVNVAGTVRRVLDSAQGTIDAQHAAVTLSDIPPVVADPAALEQVFANLIANALRYRDPSRPCRIEIGGKYEDDGRSVRYYVKDNGLGIAPDVLPQMFTAFRRFHPDSGPGEGMGLLTVHRILERHHGKIRVESVPGEGSTFSFELPNVPEPDPQ